ncbi:hypothetical protein PI125_g26834 [Phytophthora idaei]|nr:hypothetical protein PI125_g26834 [Phytophthora idaei]
MHVGALPGAISLECWRWTQSLSDALCSLTSAQLNSDHRWELSRKITARSYSKTQARVTDLFFLLEHSPPCSVRDL